MSGFEVLLAPANSQTTKLWLLLADELSCSPAYFPHDVLVLLEFRRNMPTIPP